MANSFAEAISQFKAIIKMMTVGKLITLALLLVGTVAGIIVLITWSGRPEFMPLFTHLSPEDAGAVVAQLRESKIPYQLSHDGGTVQIPRERVYEVRLDMASQGLPQGGGTGFEVFDDTKLGMTEFVQNINYQRALQGELSRTIKGLAEVEGARVHIVMAPRSLFIEEEEPASASVILKLHHSRWLSDDQIQGIVHLVSSSVPRLEPEHVTVVDQNGKLLAGRKDQPTAAKISSEQLEFQQLKEKMLEKQVLTMLEKVLGQDKAIVRVACDLDFIQQEQTEEMFLPENQVVRSEQLSSETASNTDAAPMGIPGLASNIVPENQPDNTPALPSGFEKKDQTRNYEIGKRTSHQIMPVGKLRYLSVAVVVDGKYETTTVGRGEKQRQETKYIPRSPDEISQLESIVKRAVNFNEARGDKVEVANIPFNTDKLIIKPEGETDASWFDRFKPYATLIKYLAVASFVLFTFLFVIRPLIRWLTDTSWEDVELLENLPRSVAELEHQYTQKDNQSGQYINQAAQMIKANQDDSARLMQQWLKET